MKDLLVLTADQDACLAIQAIINKIPVIEKISNINFNIFKHPHRDAGVLNHAIEFVRPYLNDYRYILVMFDYEGCGHESKQKNIIESEMEKKLSENGWDGRNACIIFKPELEIWLWVNRKHILNLIDWKESNSIDSWLKSKGFLLNEQTQKPERPKEAFASLLKQQKIPRSSSIFVKLAEQASYQQCLDPSFIKFISVIRKWFKN